MNASTGVGSRGGNVRSVEQADYLHRQHKRQWTAKVRRRIAETLLATGYFHADDLADLAIPEEHCSIVGSQVSLLSTREGLMEYAGRRASKRKAANARKSNVYRITGKGRVELPRLVGVGAGQGTPGATPCPSSAPALTNQPTAASADPGEPLSLLPDDRPPSAYDSFSQAA